MTKTGEEGESHISVQGLAGNARATDGAAADDQATRRPVGRPCRPLPDDFEALWPTMSRDEAEEHWRCHKRSIERWLDACGRDRLILARKLYREAQRQVSSRARRKRYVIGRTMTPVGDRP